MTDEILARVQQARIQGEPCVLVTVAETKGSVPRAAGAKMVVFATEVLGTVGGGKFEALVVGEARAIFGTDLPVLKRFPLHENSVDSFGAICGGEMTVLLEPLHPREKLTIVGAGHCARALAELALTCGWHVTVIDDREEYLSVLPQVHRRLSDVSAGEFIANHPWNARDALVLISRNCVLDESALRAAVGQGEIGYLGMIGSQRKVRRVFENLLAQGAATPETLARVFAPVGLDIGADSPAEIAISVLAEIMAVLRKRDGRNLRLRD